MIVILTWQIIQNKKTNKDWREYLSGTLKVDGIYTPGSIVITWREKYIRELRKVSC